MLNTLKTWLLKNRIAACSIANALPLTTAAREGARKTEGTPT